MSLSERVLNFFTATRVGRVVHFLMPWAVAAWMLSDLIDGDYRGAAYIGCGWVVGCGVGYFTAWLRER